MSYTHRTQVLLNAEQRQRVEVLAVRTGRSVGAVIRDAIDQYAAPASSEQRWEALDRLFALDASVGDWDDLEAEIVAGASEGLPPAGST